MLHVRRFFNLQSVKAKQTAASRAKARREAAEKAAGLGGVLGSDDEDESDAEVGSEDIDDVEIDAALQVRTLQRTNLDRPSTWLSLFYFSQAACQLAIRVFSRR